MVITETITSENPSEFLVQEKKPTQQQLINHKICTFYPMEMTAYKLYNKREELNHDKADIYDENTKSA